MQRKIFNESEWPSLLPSELCDFRSEIDRHCRDKYLKIPYNYWPSILVEGNGNFWACIKEGKDTKDLDNLAYGEKGSELVFFVSQDPCALVGLVSLNLTLQEQISEFYTNLMDEMKGVLKESNHQEGEFCAKVVQAKVKIYSSFKQQAEGLFKLKDSILGFQGHKNIDYTPVGINNDTELFGIQNDTEVKVGTVSEEGADGVSKVPLKLQKDDRENLDAEYKKVMSELSSRHRTENV